MQYLEYLPEPSVGANECNSTEHYNGLLHNGNFICAGGREARTQCKVRSTCHSVIHSFIQSFIHSVILSISSRVRVRPKGKFPFLQKLKFDKQN